MLGLAVPHTRAALGFDGTRSVCCTNDIAMTVIKNGTIAGKHVGLVKKQCSPQNGNEAVGEGGVRARVGSWI